MQPIDISKRSIGINFDEGGKAAINIWAPLAKKVEVKAKAEGQVTAATIALEKQAFGYWSATTDRIKEGALYKIQVDEQEPFPDPTSLSQPEGVHGHSAAVNIADFRWTNSAWNNLPLEEYLIYELHTGTFTADGTFASIEEKLDYLKELGISAIEIMPVAQFPGTRNWGYDGVFLFAVQHSYGGWKGLQHLVDTCHQKGLAVILDVVYNHLGPEGNYLGTYGPFFTNKYNTPWGSAINFDDAWSDGVRRFVVENALMWFRDFRIDALRLDAVHAIKDFSPVHILKEIRLRVDELMRKTGRTHYLIAELDLNDTRFIDPLEKGGYALDAQWTDEFHHALRVTSGQEKSGYYSDFIGIDHLAKSYRDAYVYDGQWSPHRHKFFGVQAGEAGGKQFIVFSQNHDQVGNRMLGERTSQLLSFELQKVLAGAVLLSPYLPLLFMGEEWSEPHPFLYFVSHTDPELADAVRKGRKAEFAAFHLKGEAPDPMDEETYHQSKLQWHLRQTGQHQTMLNWYKALIQLRKNHAVLKNLDRKTVSVAAYPDSQTLVLHRWQDNQKLVCLMNFSSDPAVIDLDKVSEWKVLLNSADTAWAGPGTAGSNENAVRLQPQSLIVLAK